MTPLWNETTGKDSLWLDDTHNCNFSNFLTLKYALNHLKQHK